MLDSVDGCAEGAGSEFAAVVIDRAARRDGWNTIGIDRDSNILRSSVARLGAGVAGMGYQKECVLLYCLAS